jgi:hypothetical protein
MNLRSVLVSLGLVLALPGLLVLPTHTAQAQKANAKVSKAKSKSKKARRSKIAEREAAALEEAKK